MNKVAVRKNSIAARVMKLTVPKSKLYPKKPTRSEPLTTADTTKEIGKRSTPKDRKFVGIDLSAETNYLFTKDFEDGIIENKNARILHNKDGGIVLMYIFADENSVIITSSQPATHEIILRLASAEKKQ